LDRKANYKIVNEDMTKWQPIIKRNREATQLDFREDVNLHKNYNNKTESKQFKDISVIREINEAQKEYNDAFKKDVDNTLNDLDEVTRGALMKNKHLLFYQELKAKRLKKIKSKLFRRIKKRQRERDNEKTFNLKISNNKDAMFEEIEKMEKKRAEVN